MKTRSFLLFTVLLVTQAVSAFAGTVITTNLPAGVSIVNIDAQQDGTASYNGDQSLFYSPFSTGGAASLLTLPVAAGKYTFRVINPTDAAIAFPALLPAQIAELYTAWTYNSPWITDYFVFDISAATDSTVPQLFDGSPDPTGFGDAASAYADAVAKGYASEIRDDPTGRDSTVYVPSYTFANPTTLVFAVPDNGLSDNTGGVSVVVTPVAAPTVTLAVLGTGTAVVGGGAGKVKVVRAGDTSDALTVRYKVKGSAVSGTDYKPLSGTVTIPAGATQAKIKIKPIYDQAATGTRTAKVKLLPSTDGSYTLGRPSVAKIKVIDNE